MFLPNEKDDDFKDVQRAGLMLFLKYKAQSRPGSSDLSSISASSVQRSQDVIDNSQEAHNELYEN